MEKEQTVKSYISRVEYAINQANNNSTKLEQAQLDIVGMSSSKIRIFLNEIVDDINTRYLEIGVWMGSTFVSALYKNKPQFALAIDNFSQFGTDVHGTYDIKNIFETNMKSNDINNYTMYNSDCFNLPDHQFLALHDELRFMKKANVSSGLFNVYLYDGGHTEKDHVYALTHYYFFLDDVFIFIVDDWNSDDVKKGTRRAIDLTGVKVHKEWELPANYNGDRELWWNGYYVAVCEKVK